MQSYLTSADLKKLRDLYGMTDSQILALFKKYRKQGNRLKKKQVKRMKRGKRGERGSSIAAPYGGKKSEFRGVSSVNYTPGLGNLAQAFNAADALRQKYALLADQKVGGHHVPDLTNRMQITENPQNERIADHFIQTIRDNMESEPPPENVMRSKVDQSIQDGTIISEYNSKLQKASFKLPKEGKPHDIIRRALDVDEDNEDNKANKPGRGRGRPRKDAAPPNPPKPPGPTVPQVSTVQSFGPPPQPDSSIDIPPPPPPSGLGLFGVASGNETMSSVPGDIYGMYGGAEEEVDESTDSRKTQAASSEFTPKQGDEDEYDGVSMLTEMQGEFADDEEDEDDEEESWYTKEAPQRSVRFKPEPEHSPPVTGIAARLSNLMRGGKGDAKINPGNDDDDGDDDEDDEDDDDDEKEGDPEDKPVPYVKGKNKLKALAASKVFVDSMRDEEGVVPIKNKQNYYIKKPKKEPKKESKKSKKK